tara:strand:+ start:61 stop:270 length:210 start_codon:yes stop_codon:yes gene_type:complete
MAIFDSTQRKVLDLALTRFGKPVMFDDITLKRIATQDEAFLKPKFNFTGLSLGTSLIPLAVIAFMVLKK